MPGDKARQHRAQFEAAEDVRRGVAGKQAVGLDQRIGAVACAELDAAEDGKRLERAPQRHTGLGMAAVVGPGEQPTVQREEALQPE